MENQADNNRPEATEAGSTTAAKQMPYTVDYCPHCSFPAEFCEYSSCYSKCRTWLQEHYPQYVKAESEVPQEKKEEAKEGAKEGATEEEKADKPEGEAKPAKKVAFKEEKEKVLELMVKKRGNKKHLTLVSNLESFGINPKDAAKKFGKKFACGSSVVENNAVEIQGDVTYDLMEYIPQEFPAITEDMIVVKEAKKEPKKEPTKK